MIKNFNSIDSRNKSKIAKIFDKQTNDILLEIEYNLKYKWIWDEKAQKMYGAYNKDEIEFFDNNTLLKSETFEIEIKNISEIIKLLLDNSVVENSYKNDLEWLIHTHDNEDYRIMCNTSLLKNKDVAISTFKTWLLLTAWLIYLDNFSEANTFIDENENWYSDLSEKYVVRI